MTPVLRDAWRLAVGTLTAVPVRPPALVDRRRAGLAMVLAPLAVVPLGLLVAVIGYGAGTRSALSPPVAALLAQVERQAEWFDRADLSSEARALIAEELAAARAGDLAPPPETPMPLTAVGVDVHPGNFLIDAHGKAWFTDLDKLQYGHPASDLAHASLYTSTKWDPAVNAELSPADVDAFIAAWAIAVPGDLADEVRPWLKPMLAGFVRLSSWMGARRIRVGFMAKSFRAAGKWAGVMVIDLPEKRT